MSPEFISSLMLSLKVAAIATAGVIVVGIPISYVLARWEFRGREAIDMALTLPLVLPPTVTGYYLVLLLGRNGVIGAPIAKLTGWSVMFTWQAAAIAAFVVSLPLMVKTARSAIASVEPSLIDVSHTLGHSELRTAISVTLPLASRGLIAGVGLTFARALGEFGATLMLAGNIPGRTDTVPLAIYTSASSGDWSGANSMAIAFTLMSGALLYFANRMQVQVRK